MARYGHMAGPHKPTWMPTWCLRGMNSDIGWSGLNRAIGRSGLNRAIGRSGLNRAIGRLKSHEGNPRHGPRSHRLRVIQRLKLHGVKSAS